MPIMRFKHFEHTPNLLECRWMHCQHRAKCGQNFGHRVPETCYFSIRILRLSNCARHLIYKNFSEYILIITHTKEERTPWINLQCLTDQLSTNDHDCKKNILRILICTEEFVTERRNSWRIYSYASTSVSMAGCAWNPGPADTNPPGPES